MRLAYLVLKYNGEGNDKNKFYNNIIHYVISIKKLFK